VVGGGWGAGGGWRGRRIGGTHSTFGLVNVGLVGLRHGCEGGVRLQGRSLHCVSVCVHANGVRGWILDAWRKVVDPREAKGCD